MDRLAAATERLAELLAPAEAAAHLPRAAESALAAAVDAFDAQAAKLNGRGVDLDARRRALARLAEHATEPALLEALDRLLTAAPAAPQMLAGLGATVVDVADEYAGRLRDEGIDPVHSLAQGARLALLFGGLIGEREVHALRTLLASPVLDREAVRVVSDLAAALAGAAEAPPRRVGPLGLVRALRDPALGRALGFLLEVGRRLGVSLDASSSKP